MSNMTRVRTACCAALAASALVPASAAAMMDTIPADNTTATPSCPGSPCLAVTRAIVFQAKVGAKRGLMTVPRSGRIVSWSVKLADPTKKQIEYFDKNFGGEAEASLTILRFGRKLRARVVAVSPPIKLTKYFGKTVEFPLEKTIEVKKGYVVALSVPTWVPALATNLTGDTSWRASRKKGACDDKSTQTTAPEGAVPQFYCLYRNEHIPYSARLISTP